MDVGVDVYEERPSLVDGAVVWTRRAGGAPARIVPDGCMDVIWHSGGLDGAELIVAGPDTRPHLSSARPGTLFVGLRLAPGTGPRLLGVPAHELRDLRAPLSALWESARVGRVAETMAERMGSGADPGHALEAVALGELRSADRADQADRADVALGEVVAAARRGTPIAAIAASVGLSERQLHRRCLDAFGYGPKTLARVLRMNRALDLARAGVAFAEVAADAGYADQAHLTREVKSLTGVPPGVLVS